MSINIASKIIRKSPRKRVISIPQQVVISRQTAAQNLRNLSSLTEFHVGKLHDAFEVYRQNNYDRELRTRFQKEMKNAVDKDRDGLFTIDEISCLLHNIGARDCLSVEQLRQMFDEISATSDNTNSNSNSSQKRHIPVESLDKFFEGE
mmetsp:Transcript_30416/g.69631  ORF Transcript_30416/g.69631 Transcript_30416/m.69631 type:complete len:148 (-) Transcript_30416:107-550(-)